MAVIAEFEIAAREAETEQPGEPDQFRFAGSLFDVVENVSTLPMLRYAAALTDRGLQSEEDRDVTPVYAAAYNLLRSLVEPKDWVRFEAVATARNANYRQLTDVAYRLYNHVTGRPTKRSSGSPDGPPPTTGASSPDSSSPATLRPDLAVPMVSVDALVSGS
jgi:hypothetical protein